MGAAQSQLLLGSSLHYIHLNLSTWRRLFVLRLKRSARIRLGCLLGLSWQLFEVIRLDSRIEAIGSLCVANRVAPMEPTETDINLIRYSKDFRSLIAGNKSLRLRLWGPVSSQWAPVKVIFGLKVTTFRLSKVSKRLYIK